MSPVMAASSDSGHLDKSSILMLVLLAYSRIFYMSLSSWWLTKRWVHPLSFDCNVTHTMCYCAIWWKGLKQWCSHKTWQPINRVASAKYHCGLSRFLWSVIDFRDNEVSQVAKLDSSLTHAYFLDHRCYRCSSQSVSCGAVSSKQFPSPWAQCSSMEHFKAVRPILGHMTKSELQQSVTLVTLLPLNMSEMGKASNPSSV